MLLDQILNMLDRLKLPSLLLYRTENLRDQGIIRPILLLDLIIRLVDCRYDLFLLVGYYSAVSLLNPHIRHISLLYSAQDASLLSGSPCTGRRKEPYRKPFTDTTLLYLVSLCTTRIYILYIYYI